MRVLLIAMALVMVAYPVQAQRDYPNVFRIHMVIGTGALRVACVPERVYSRAGDRYRIEAFRSSRSLGAWAGVCDPKGPHIETIEPLRRGDTYHLCYGGTEMLLIREDGEVVDVNMVGGGECTIPAQ